MSDDIKKTRHGLAVTMVNGRLMVAEELVEGLALHYEQTLQKLADAIKREGFLIIHETASDSFICQRLQ